MELNAFILRLPRIYMFHPNPYTYTDGIKCLISDRYLIEQAIKGETIEIWGDPERLLETICVKDFLQIIEKCVESSLDGGIYNAGSGGSTLKERIQGIVEVFSPKNTHLLSYIVPRRKVHNNSFWISAKQWNN